MEKKIFTRKPHSGHLYKWSPDTDMVQGGSNKARARATTTRVDTPTGCDAVKFSQGEDWGVTYVYEFVYDINGPHHYAYVQCGYVE